MLIIIAAAEADDPSGDAVNRKTSKKNKVAAAPSTASASKAKLPSKPKRTRTRGEGVDWSEHLYLDGMTSAILHHIRFIIEIFIYKPDIDNKEAQEIGQVNFNL
ncbi:hypothetical protein ACJX0J_039657 [Zea mays]